MYTKIDARPINDRFPAFSIVSDGNEAVIFDTKTEIISQKIKLTDEISPKLNFMKFETSVGRTNLSIIRSESRKLAFNISEDQKENIMVIDIPSGFMPVSEFSKRISTKVVFDTANETLFNMEVIEHEADGTKITTTTQPIYEESEGVSIKIGEITVIESEKSVVTADVDYDVMPKIINTIEEIQEIDQESANKLIAEGSAVEVDDITLGDPRDNSSVSTNLSLYNDILINQTPDSTFNILRRGK